MSKTHDTTAEHDSDRAANPAQKPEKVEDRPNVSTVSPEDYPEKAGILGSYPNSRGFMCNNIW